MAAGQYGKKRTVRAVAAAALLGAVVAVPCPLSPLNSAADKTIASADRVQPVEFEAANGIRQQKKGSVEVARSAAAHSPIAIAALANATFIQTTGLADAWKLLRRDVVGTIAIVDTGVDLKNAALAPYLTDGVNLLDEGEPPQDDNGHGTAVAGVIAAAAEAAKGQETSAAWKMKLMPIKALDDKGEGDEEHLSGSIRYAIEHGADIVVLSLGLRRDAPDMRSVVALAEQKGVLLVAATGNDAAEFGEQAAVQYPAAYPTVLAVAGAEGGEGQINSTGGPEVDLAASWRVETLALGGGRLSMEGTSMAAPQVAAAVALLRAAHPDWKPALLRETLRRSAEDIGIAGRDDATGYGLLRADRALSAGPNADWREPNGAQSSASPFPPGTEVYAAWSGSKDTDWYEVSVPYEGLLTVRMQTNLFDIGATGVKLSLYRPGAVKPIAAGATGGTMSWKLGKGKYYLRADGSSKSASLPYRLTSGFRMAPDRTEPGSSSDTAYAIEPRTQEWTGTFDREDDQDWTVVKLPQAGSLKITVETDTTRIDPAIAVQRSGQSPVWTDESGDGLPETASVKNAQAGRYYIGVRNAAAGATPPVIGTYKVRLEYTTTYADLGEPNDGPLTAAALVEGAGGTLKGLIAGDKDQDWFRFKTSGGGRFEWKLTGIPDGSVFQLAIYDKELKPVGKWSNKDGASEVDVRQKLQAGTYYARITADRADRSAYYRISVMNIE